VSTAGSEHAGPEQRSHSRAHADRPGTALPSKPALLVADQAGPPDATLSRPDRVSTPGTKKQPEKVQNLSYTALQMATTDRPSDQRGLSHAPSCTTTGSPAGSNGQCVSLASLLGLVGLLAALLVAPAAQGWRLTGAGTPWLVTPGAAATPGSTSTDDEADETSARETSDEGTLDGATTDGSATETAAPEPAQVWAPSAAGWSRAAGYEQFLVGAIVNGEDAGTLDVLQEHDIYLIPLEDLAAITGCEVTTEGDLVTLVTPLGPVALGRSEIRVLEGTTYLAHPVIEQRLATRIRFDPEEFALLFDLPWGLHDERPVPKESATLTPDARPPKASLSTIQTDIDLQGDEESQTTVSSTVLGGRIAQGWWRLRYQDDFDGTARLQEYAWLRPMGQTLLQIGHQRVQLHPLLSGVELTGAQLGWTNKPLQLFSRRWWYPSELLPRHSSPIRTFRGPAPPAGIAELWVDGVLTARQNVGLDGQYEFIDMVLPARQSHLEIRLYERENPTVPVSRIEQTLNLSGLLLADGTTTILGGAGIDDNLADELFNRNPSTDAAAFYQIRHGISDGITLESAVQHNGDGSQLMGGLVARLSDTFLVSAGAATNDRSRSGYHLELDGAAGPWRLVGLSRWQEEGFASRESEESFDHLLELDYRSSPRLRLGLTGRSFERSGQSDEFVLPTIAWAPTRRLSLAARPDSNGNYRLDMRVGLPRNGSLTVTVLDRTFAGLSYGLSSRTHLFLGAEVGGGMQERFSSMVSWSGSGRWRPSISGGPLWSDGEVGYRALASMALTPGVLARFEVERDPLLAAGIERTTTRFRVGITADLTLSRGRLLPARSVSVREDRGALSGRIRIISPIPLPDYELADVVIAINGRSAGSTEPGGSYFIGDLRPGLYRVSLDPEKLPIELVPVRTSLIAEVAAATVTTLDLEVRPMLGVAGRITGNDRQPLAGVVVELVATDGEARGDAVAAATTDRFGLYRMDGIAIGSYSLRISPASLPGTAISMPELPVTVGADFLFGQDLELPITLHPDPAAGTDSTLNASGP